MVGRHRIEAARELSWKEIQVSAKPVNNNNYNVKNGNEIQSDIRKEKIGEFCRVLSQEFDFDVDEIGNLIGALA